MAAMACRMAVLRSRTTSAVSISAWAFCSPCGLPPAVPSAVAPRSWWRPALAAGGHTLADHAVGLVDRLGEVVGGVVGFTGNLWSHERMHQLAQQRALGDAARLGDGLEPIEVRARDHGGQPGVGVVAVGDNRCSRTGYRSQSRRSPSAGGYSAASLISAARSGRSLVRGMPVLGRHNWHHPVMDFARARLPRFTVRDSLADGGVGSRNVFREIFVAQYHFENGQAGREFIARYPQPGSDRLQEWCSCAANVPAWLQIFTASDGAICSSLNGWNTGNCLTKSWPIA